MHLHNVYSTSVYMSVCVYNTSTLINSSPMLIGRSIFFAPCRVVTIVMEERFRYSNDDGASNEGTFLCVIVLSSVGDTTLMWTPFFIFLPTAKLKKFHQ